MDKKSVIIAIVLLMIILPLSLAQNATGYEKGYECLENKLDDNCDSQSTEQTVFSLLAMAYDSSIQSDCKSSLMDKESNNCWGETDSASCNIKSTAQAIIALNHIGEDTDDYVEWLEDNRELTEELNWYLQIDSNNETTCEINNNDFIISDNKKISGSSSCLSQSQQGYFLKIKDSCLDKNFTISCDSDFISSLFYKKPREETYHISSVTHSAPAHDSTIEKVESYCFGTSGCDYEGSLWAALAFSKLDKEVNPYIPYISAMSDEAENKKYLSSAFLYSLTNEDDYANKLINKQNSKGYWNENKKYYDTALAISALPNRDATDLAKDWLLDVQGSEGCWNSQNIRDTAFILYAGWPTEPASTTGTSRQNCEDYGYYCVTSGKCSETLGSYYCSGLSEVCCETQPQEETCAEKNGIICEDNQKCTGSEVIASDTDYCCLDSCTAIQTENECEEAGYTCASECLENEEEKIAYSNSCDYGEICCGTKPSEEGGSWLLIILLIILIILVILAIIYREQLKVWFFKIKSRFKSGGSPPSSKRPPRPPSTPPLRTQRTQRRPVRRPPMKRPPRNSKKDSVFEETMKKLRDMSK